MSINNLKINDHEIKTEEDTLEFYPSFVKDEPKDLDFNDSDIFKSE